MMHLLEAKGQRKEHSGGGEPASGFAFQGHVLPHLAYNRCTHAATRPRGRPGPPASSRGPAAAHAAAGRDMPGDTRGLSSRSVGSGAAQPGERTRAVTKARGGCSRRALAAGEPRRCGHRLPRAAPSPAGTGPAGRPPSPRPGPAGPARSPPAGRAGGARACPTALFLIRAELASGPSPPARPPRPGGRSPNVSRPAWPSPRSPPGRTLRGAFPAPQPPSPPAAPPLARAPLPAAAARGAASARAHRGVPGRRGAGR